MSLMAEEIAEIPAAAARLLADRATLNRIGADLRARDPAMLLTIARGSSDHAAGYLKYLVEIECGIPVASLGPSVASVYDRPLHAGRAVSVAISQSGASPDLIAAQQAVRAGGGQALALTNHPESPLGRGADSVLDICAGPERAVAATKSFLNTCIACAALIAHWREDAALLTALDHLPERLAEALACDWSAAGELLAPAPSGFVLGRGPGYPIAGEMALKLKEVAGIGAQAYSAAEVQHGPAAIAGSGFPILALAVDDAARPAILNSADRLAAQGALVLVTGRELPLPEPLHPALDSLIAVAAFYVMAEALAARLGRDPDAPPHLKKVTETR